MSTEKRRKLFSWAVVGLFALQGIGTIVAIVKKLPYEVGGVGDPDNIVRDFLFGSGTALSAPFVVLVILALLLLATRRQDRWGTIALGAIALLTAVMTTFSVLEPIVLRTLRSAPFGLFTVAVVVINWGSVLLLITLIVLSILELVQRRRAAQ